MFGFDFGKARRIMIGFINVVIHVRDMPWWAWLLIIAAMYPSAAGSIWSFLSGQERFESLMSIVSVFFVIFGVWRILSLTPLFSKKTWDTNDWIVENIPSRHLVRHFVIFMLTVWIGGFLTEFVLDVFIEHRLSKLTENDRQHVAQIGLQFLRANPGDLVVYKNGRVEVVLSRSDSVPNMGIRCKRKQQDEYYNFKRDGGPTGLYSIRDMLAIRKVIKPNDVEYSQYSSQCDSYASLRRQHLIDMGVPKECIDQPRGTVYWCGLGQTGYCECR